MRTVTECQRRLISLGYLATGEDDGRFGAKSLDAFNHYRASKGLGPVVQTSMAELNAVLFPEDTTPTPQRKTIMGNLLGSIFSGLLGNLLNWQLIQGYLRNALLAVGSATGYEGFVGHDGSVTTVGAVMTIVGVVLSAISANTKRKAIDVVKAVDAAPGVTLIRAADTATGKPKVVATP